jgi:hypothetical protein
LLGRWLIHHDLIDVGDLHLLEQSGYDLAHVELVGVLFSQC